MDTCRFGCIPFCGSRASRRLAQLARTQKRWGVARDRAAGEIPPGWSQGHLAQADQSWLLRTGGGGGQALRDGPNHRERQGRQTRFPQKGRGGRQRAGGLSGSQRWFHGVDSGIRLSLHHQLRAGPPGHPLGGWRQGLHLGRHGQPALQRISHRQGGMGKGPSQGIQDQAAPVGLFRQPAGGRRFDLHPGWGGRQRAGGIGQTDRQGSLARAESGGSGLQSAPAL